MYYYANQTFKREYIGYRFIKKLISPISDENEIQSLSEAINNKFDIVHDHILKANFFLSDRIQPDYENSIKESICAVEALCVIITGARGNDATLGKMLKKLEDNGVVIHNAMKSAFGSLYGFTNDANGIRHAGDIGGPSSTFEEAKYMLVSCSAFVNYLTALMSD